MKKQSVNYDPESDILYIIAKRGEEESFVEITPGVNVELNDRGEVIGIEILNASRFFRPVAKPLFEHINL